MFFATELEDAVRNCGRATSTSSDAAAADPCLSSAYQGGVVS